MLAERRRELVLQLARRSDGAKVGRLARRFGVSEMTIRRDLDLLADAGKLTRVHGGAIGDSEEPPFARTAIERLAEKDRVGRAAAGTVQDGQTIIIDIGTTTLQLARHLHGRRLTVVTSSLAVVEELLPDSDIELVVLGGIVRRNYRSMVGVLTQDALHQISADVAFLGASSVTGTAVMDSTRVEVASKRAMMAAATRRLLLVDAAKFAHHSPIRICGLDQFDAVVTDAGEGSEGVARVRRAGVVVVRAEDTCADRAVNE